MIKGFTCGTFDFLHAGHLLMLKQCKEKCDVLIVGLQVDPSIEREEKNKPVETLLERQIRLKACRYVDQIIVYEKDEDLITIIKMLKINVRFIGSDYIKNKVATDKIKYAKLVPIIFTEWFPPSSSELRKRVKKAK